MLIRGVNHGDGWIGFNASHGPGIVLFAGPYLLLAVGHTSWLSDSPVRTWLPVAGGAACLAIARRYFFRRPFMGVAIATACFLAAWTISFRGVGHGV